MIEFIQDDDRLRDARKKAKKNKDKYVGMSSDSMGFRSRGFGGFDSPSSGGGGGWKDEWNSGGGGRSNSNPSGFRDHSDEEGSRDPSPDVSEFRDDDYSPPGSIGSKKFTDNSTISSQISTASRPTSTITTSSVKSQQTPSKSTKNVSKKPLDLGAAAAFASAGNSVTTNNQKPKQSSLDLFGEPEPETEPVENQQQQSVNLFGGDDEDDFNPRGEQDSANANGDFGDFENAFGEESAQKSNNGDSFADFSSAFGTTSGSTTSALPGPPTPHPSQSSSNLELIGSSVNPGNNPGSSNVDLLGGLLGSSSASGGPPPLVGMSSLMGNSAGTSSMILNQAAPQSMPPVVNPMGSTDLFNQLQQQPVMMNPKSNNNHNVTSIASASSLTSAEAAKKSTLWDNVGSVNINLDNLSLKGGNDKKTGVPMNSMVTPNSSPLKAQGGVMGPPPLKSVGQPEVRSQPASQSSFDFNDLLN